MSIPPSTEPAAAAPRSTRASKVRSRTWRIDDLVDGAFFLAGALLVIWLGYVLVTRQVTFSWQSVVAFVAYWLLLTYVALPRLQEVLAGIYVPDYFIGRTVTGQGILGDPVNLGLEGSAAQLCAAMERAGWTRADEITLGSSWGIVASSVLRRSYPSAPVSPLLLFGRRQHVAYEQEVAGNASQRHHVRFWPAPDDWRLPGGHRVGWLGAATYDRAVGLSLFTLQVTHKVDADIDVERDHVVASVREANPEVGVEIVRNFSSAFHARNGGGDLVHTDGHLPVLDLSEIAVEPDNEPPPSTVRRRVAHRHVPPPQLVVAGVMSLAKTAFAVYAALASAASTRSLVTTGLTAMAMVLLWGLTLAHRAWARLLLIAVCLVEAVARLLDLSATTRGHFYLSLTTGISLLVLIAVSSTSARRWVTS